MAKQYLDKTGLQHYHEKVKELINSGGSGGGEFNIPTFEITYDEWNAGQISDKEKMQKLAELVQNNNSIGLKIKTAQGSNSYNDEYYIGNVAHTYASAFGVTLETHLLYFLRYGNAPSSSFESQWYQLTVLNANQLGNYISIEKSNVQLINNNKEQTITAKKAFTELPISDVVPTEDNQFVNKKYVDEKASAIKDEIPFVTITVDMKEFTIENGYSGSFISYPITIDKNLIPNSNMFVMNLKSTDEQINLSGLINVYLMQGARWYCGIIYSFFVVIDSFGIAMIDNGDTYTVYIDKIKYINTDLGDIDSRLKALEAKINV